MSGSTVLPRFSKSSKQIKFQVKAMFANGENVGLAEWIINNICPSYVLYGNSWSILLSVQRKRPALFFSQES